MKRLKSLQIDSTRISDLSPLLATPILEYADVRTSVSSSLAALVGHRGLRKITVNSDNNSDWASLRELPNLEEIFNDADVRGALTPCPHATAKCTTRHIDD